MISHKKQRTSFRHSIKFHIRFQVGVSVYYISALDGVSWTERILAVPDIIQRRVLIRHGIMSPHIPLMTWPWKETKKVSPEALWKVMVIHS